MEFEFSEAERDFVADVRAFVEKEVQKPGVRPKGGVGARYKMTDGRRSFMKELAKAGYLGISWPKEFGGKGMSSRYDYLLQETVAYLNAPGTGKGIGIIGRSIMTHGTDEQKETLLPLILNAEIEWAIGYSEPDSGSDLASLKLKAVREGDGWRINGQKRFNTSVNRADWYFLAARTDNSGPKHRGITLFLIDLKNTPGITAVPMHCVSDEETCEVFFDDVFVADTQRFGEEGNGFRLISQALDFERHSLFPHGTQQRIFDTFLEWVKTAVRDGAPVSQDPDVRREVARLAVRIEAGRMLSFNALGREGYDAAVACAMNKMTGSETYQHLANRITDVIGPATMLRTDAEDEVCDGLFEWIHRAGIILTIGAGANEVQRNIIARRGLGLPNPN